MRGWIGSLILTIILVPVLALSEIYCWVDDHSIQNYTTRLESVPESYRSGVQTLSLPTPPVLPELQPSVSQPGLTRVPFTPGSPVMVSARINSVGPIALILDTGSDRTVVKSSALERLGISADYAGQVVLQGVTGTGYGSAVWVNSVEVGEARVGPLLIIVHDTDLKGADGLLGRDYLAQFHVTIDSKERIVTLTPN
jgi:hypothetical protein